MKQKPTITELPPRFIYESDAKYDSRIAAWLRGDDVRVKTDLKDFKSCDFTLAPEK